MRSVALARLRIGLLLAAVTVLLAACATTPPFPGPVGGGGGCEAPRAYTAAAAVNAVSLTGLAFAPFGRDEHGWEVYAPAAAASLGSPCAPASPGFAAALARWQADHGLPPDGRMDAATFQTIKGERQASRPFLMTRTRGICPDPPPDYALAAVDPSETTQPQPPQLRVDALAAYRAMVAAARAELPELAGDPDALKLVSGYRSPAADAAHCAAADDCNGITRAECSAHRTGLAMDLIIGFKPGFTVDAAADDNRLYQSKTAVYRWLLANAARFGFVNYLFEPWHWEWTGPPDEVHSTF